MSLENQHQGRVGKIPVKNLWLLMLYASEIRFLVPQLSSDEESIDNVANLIAEVFCDLVDNRLKKNLSTEFVRSEREINRVRGHINVLATARKMSLSKGKVICSFDELTLDSERNRYLRSAFNRLKSLVDKACLSRRCHNISQRLQNLGVAATVNLGYKPSRQRFARHEANDRQVLLVAELAHDMHLLSDTLGNKLLPSPDKQEEWVRKLFEKAVGGIYKLKLPPHEWYVKAGKKIEWPVERGTLPGKDLLPTMKLDILLENKIQQQRLIIDTKFTNIIRTGRFGKKRFKSEYIYQLYSYILSQKKCSDPLSMNASGMLLHPSIGDNYDEFVCIHGHDIRFCTVDLSLNSELVVSRLLDLVVNNYSVS